MSVQGRLAARKSLIVAQSELSRLEWALAWQDLRASVAPPRSDARSASVRRIATLMIAVATPLLGRTRFARVLRFASVGLAAFRAIRAMRGSGG